MVHSMRINYVLVIIDFVLVLLFLFDNVQVVEGFLPVQQQQQQQLKSKSSSLLLLLSHLDERQPQSISIDNTRRNIVSSITAVMFGTTLYNNNNNNNNNSGFPLVTACNAVVETIGKDPNCNDATCLGIWDGLLADCAQTTTIDNRFLSAGCVSSQDDTPGTFAEPWDYSDDDDTNLLLLPVDNNNNIQSIMERIVNAIVTISNRRGDTVEIVLQDQRYLHVIFTDESTGVVSDGEFYITPNDTTIQFRLSSNPTTTTVNSRSNNNNNNGGDRRSLGQLLFRPSLSNMERAELIRKELHWLKLPILRNRQRVLFFVESDLDKFGPRSAALGPPESMKINDINGIGRGYR